MEEVERFPFVERTVAYCVDIRLALIECYESCTCISLWLGRGEDETRSYIVDSHLVMMGRGFRVGTYCAFAV